MASPDTGRHATPGKNRSMFHTQNLPSPNINPNTILIPGDGVHPYSIYNENETGHVPASYPDKKRKRTDH